MKFIAEGENLKAVELLKEKEKEKIIDYMIDTAKKRVIALDFDGTLVQGDCWMYHSFVPLRILLENPAGSAFVRTIDIAKRWKQHGHDVILWTCRENGIYKDYPDALTAAVDWCRSEGLIFDGVNESSKMFEKTRRKIIADRYVDDKSCCITEQDSWDMFTWE